MNLIANLQSTKEIVPAIGSLDDPASGLESGIGLAFLFFLATRFDMGDVPSPHRRTTQLRVIVALIATEVLARFALGRGSGHDNRVERGTEHLHVVPVGARECGGQRNAVGVREGMAFGAQFTPVGGVFSGQIPPLTGAETVALSSDWKRQSMPWRSS
jgi:hypothetical protein